MTTLNISLPESMRDYIVEKIKTDGYSTASEYVRALIRDDQKRQAQERLESQLMEGLASGPPLKMTSKDMEAIRTRLHKAAGGRKPRARR